MGRIRSLEKKGLWVMLPLVVLAIAATGCAKVATTKGWAQPEVVNKVMYVTLDKGKLTAVDPVKGFTKIWTFPAADDVSCGGGAAQKYTLEGIYGQPAVDAANVYYSTYDGAVWSVKQSDATCNWRVEMDGNLVAAPVLKGDALYVTSTDGYVYELDAKDGSQKSKFNTGEAWATPLLTDDGLYVATMKGELWKLDPTDLHNLWPAPFKVSAALLTPPAIVGDNTVVVGGIGRKLYGVNTDSGQQSWVADGSNWFWGEPAVEGTTLYTTDLDGQVKAIDGTNGKSLWATDFQALESIRAGAVVVGDMVIAVDNSGEIYRIDKATGTQIGQPNLLNEDVLTRPLVYDLTTGRTPAPTNIGARVVTPTPVSGGAAAQALATGTTTGSPTVAASAAPSGSAGGDLVYIVTQGGNVYEFDADAAQTKQVLTK
ncbi:MAG: PQQ-binding-like beta-propeller repeat protein [Chloroflexota bacterium]